MMFQTLRGMGQATAGTTDAQTTANCLAEYAADLAQYGPIFGPAAVLGNPNCYSVIYQQMMYGTLPNAPQAAASATPTPPTQEQIDSSTPDQIAQQLAASQNANATAAAQQAIADAIANGTYNPAGNLPTPPGIPQSTWMIILAAAGLGLFVLVAVKR